MKGVSIQTTQNSHNQLSLSQQYVSHCCLSIAQNGLFSDYHIDVFSRGTHTSYSFEIWLDSGVFAG